MQTNTAPSPPKVSWLSLEESAYCAQVAFVSEEVSLLGALAPEFDGE